MAAEEIIDLNEYDTYANSKAFKVKLPFFNEGPLDLLLHLIKESKINIYDIPISDITHQYLTAIQLMKKLDIELAADFLLMAATLIFIKSRMMLPAEMNEGDENDFLNDPRTNLVEQLLEYQKFKKLAEVLEDQEFHTTKIIERKDNQITFDLPKKEDDAWKEVNLFELIKVFSGVVDVMDYDDFDVLRTEEVRIEDKIDQIELELKRAGKLNFYDLFPKASTKQIIIVTFWAILELYKVGVLTIKQHAIFGDIYIFFREKRKEVESFTDINKQDE